jgi:hypothetical protein
MRMTAASSVGSAESRAAELPCVVFYIWRLLEAAAIRSTRLLSTAPEQGQSAQEGSGRLHAYAFGDPERHG